jgi:hypothetical protein
LVQSRKLLAMLQRRRVVLAGVAAMIATCLPASLYAQQPITLEAFVALSKELTGAADLDPAVARTILSGFLALGRGPALARLAANSGSDPYPTALGNAVVAAWYSGIYATGKAEAVATFYGALLWSALTYTKPFGACGGETGYWASAPQQ